MLASEDRHRSGTTTFLSLAAVCYDGPVAALLCDSHGGCFCVGGIRASAYTWVGGMRAVISTQSFYEERWIFFSERSCLAQQPNKRNTALHQQNSTGGTTAAALQHLVFVPVFTVYLVCSRGWCSAAEYRATATIIRPAQQSNTHRRTIGQVCIRSIQQEKNQYCSSNLYKPRERLRFLFPAFDANRISSQLHPERKTVQYHVKYVHIIILVL